jgi:glycosyltransferase involved in cell wall biosynthesis
MRLYIQCTKNDTGKRKFIERLMPELEKLGVHCQEKPHGADVCLGVAYFEGKPKMPRVLRVNGLHLLKNKVNKWRNSQARKSIKMADAVIWQSKFCEKMYKGILKVRPKQEHVIFNGANPEDYNVEPIRSPYPKNVLLCAKWFRKTGVERRHKRLKEMLRIAQTYCELHDDVGFWVAGRAEKRVFDHPRIKFLGRVPEQELRRYYVMADLMMYLAFIDWCPNSVVECICAGTPVLVSNNSGTVELGSHLVELDKPIKAKYMKNDRPPKIKDEKVIAMLDEMLANPQRIHRNELTIQCVARRYKKVLESVAR